MVVQDVRLQEQIGRNERPGQEKGCQPDQGVAAPVTARTTGLDDVLARLERVEAQHHEALDQVPVGEGHAVDEVRNEGQLRHANRVEHRICPDVAAAKVSSGREDRADDQNALDRSVDDSECESFGVVLVPGLDVERQDRCDVALVEIPPLKAAPFPLDYI